MTGQTGDAVRRMHRYRECHTVARLQEAEEGAAVAAASFLAISLSRSDMRELDLEVR